MAAVINAQINEEDTSLSSRLVTKSSSKKPHSVDCLATKVSAKLEERDFKGAVRLVCSEDTFAETSDATYAALREKHPAPPLDSSISPPPTQVGGLNVSEPEIVKAILSFPCGSAGGPDGLRLQHLKDMIGPRGDGAAGNLVSSLAAFAALVLSGEVPVSIRPFFFGANITALQKKDGGIRPIAVGCTLRRLVAKVAGARVMEEMGALLAPRQLGYGTKLGSEAAVHAARLFLQHAESSAVMVKLDFCNAFNSIRWDKMLECVQDLAPDLFAYVHSAYSAPSSLFWGDKILHSAEGLQQGDPLGPLLFCLSIHHLCTQLKSELCIFYLDDGTLGGSMETVLHDLALVEQLGSKLGLKLNCQKSELFCSNDDARAAILSSLQGARVIDLSDASLLGSPIGSVRSIESSLREKIELLRRMGSRLSGLLTQDALLLLAILCNS